MLRLAGCAVQSGFQAGQRERRASPEALRAAFWLFVRAHPGHRPSALRKYNKLKSLPESFGQLTALQTLDLSQRSACATVWRGPCAAVGWVRGAEVGSRQARQSGGFSSSTSRRVLVVVLVHPVHRPSAFRNFNKLEALPESFGQLTALLNLDLSQRSACAEVWRGPCAAVAWVRGAEWVSRQARQSGRLFQKHFAQGSV